MTRVFLHVGSPKTGTTFLQGVLWSQRERAREQGLLLPLDTFHDHYLASLDVRGLAQRPQHRNRAEGMWRRLVAETHAWPDTVLVSHELFASATAEQAEQAITAFRDDVEVHVVLTVRDLVRQIPAEWQEHVKHRYTRSLPDFIEELRRDRRHKTWFWKVQDFADVAERWGRSLPASRVHVVTVPPAGAPSDLLWSRFATLLGLDPASFDLELPRSNTSLGLEQVELLRRVNAELGDRLPLPGPYAGVVKNVLAHRILSARTGTRLAMSVADTEFALERSRVIAERLGGSDYDIVGSLDELTPDGEAALAAAWPSYPEPSETVLFAEAVAALASTLAALEASRSTRQQFEHRLREAERAPLRSALVRASERWTVLGHARRGYRALRELPRRSRRRSTRRSTPSR